MQSPTGSLVNGIQHVHGMRSTPAHGYHGNLTAHTDMAKCAGSRAQVVERGVPIMARHMHGWVLPAGDLVPLIFMQHNTRLRAVACRLCWPTPRPRVWRAGSSWRCGARCRARRGSTAGTTRRWCGGYGYEHMDAVMGVVCITRIAADSVGFRLHPHVLWDPLCSSKL